MRGLLTEALIRQAAITRVGHEAAAHVLKAAVGVLLFRIGLVDHVDDAMSKGP
jgi:hypothetical protein